MLECIRPYSLLTYENTDLKVMISTPHINKKYTQELTLKTCVQSLNISYSNKEVKFEIDIDLYSNRIFFNDNGNENEILQ